MANLGDVMRRVVDDSIPNGAYALKVARYRAAYLRAVRATWSHSAAAAEMVLDHTNAFYVRRDDRPRIGPDADKPYIVGEVCIHDSTVRSEVNARLEMLKGALMDEGVDVDDLRIVTSTWGMKRRHPFAGQGTQAADPAPRQAGGRRLGSRAAGLQTVKRAFCLVFGEAAESVLAQVGAASLRELPSKARSVDGRGSAWFECCLYSADEDFPNLVAANAAPIVSAARTLGLNLGAVRGIQRDDLKGMQAFPVAGYPMASDALEREEGADERA